MSSKKKFRYYYWDACIFVSYINNHNDRAANIQRMLEEVSSERDIKIITSAISIAEVAFANKEKETNTLDPMVEEALEEFWASRDVVLVSTTNGIMRDARRLMRCAIEERVGGLKPFDAVHLATAEWVDLNVGRVINVHSYERRWIEKFTHLVPSLEICKPVPKQMSIPWE